MGGQGDSKSTDAWVLYLKKSCIAVYKSNILKNLSPGDSNIQSKIGTVRERLCELQLWESLSSCFAAWQGPGMVNSSPRGSESRSALVEALTISLGLVYKDGCQK